MVLGSGKNHNMRTVGWTDERCCHNELNLSVIAHANHGMPKDNGKYPDRKRNMLYPEPTPKHKVPGTIQDPFATNNGVAKLTPSPPPVVINLACCINCNESNGYFVSLSDSPQMTSPVDHVEQMFNRIQVR